MLLQEIYRALITSVSSSGKKNSKNAKRKNSNIIFVIQIIWQVNWFYWVLLHRRFHICLLWIIIFFNYEFLSLQFYRRHQRVRSLSYTNPMWKTQRQAFHHTSAPQKQRKLLVFWACNPMVPSQVWAMIHRGIYVLLSALSRSHLQQRSNLTFAAATRISFWCALKYSFMERMCLS